MKDFLARLLNVCKKPYGYWFITFIFCQVIFAGCLKNGLVPWAGGVERGLTGCMMVSVYILVFLNTIHFSGHITPIVSCVPDGGKSTEESFGFVIFALHSSVFIAGVLALLVLLAWFDVFRWDLWRIVMQISEGGSVLMFLIFLITDLCCLDICNRAYKANGTATQYEDETKMLEKYICGVDLPGVLGLLLILFLSHHIYPYKAAYINTASVAYWQGFTTGAIALHIAFSQGALALLSATKT